MEHSPQGRAGRGHLDAAPRLLEAPEMPNTEANGITIEYDTFGRPDADPLLLVMGLGQQLIAWDEDFCQAIADRGHFVVRFDNRDVGLSTPFDDAGLPDLVSLLDAHAQGDPMDVPYLLTDMAADAVGLLDALEIEAAHVVGASMGGMIVQTMAIESPERVQTMTSIMSNTGRADGTPPSPEAMAVLMTPPPSGRDEVIEHTVKTNRVIGSPGFDFDEERVRRRAARSFDRAFRPQGTARQLAAISASGSRTEGLAGLDLPTLVIHGDADPLVHVDNGRDTHASIPGSELLVIEGMGHDLPVGTWSPIIDGIVELAGAGRGA